MGCRKHAPGKPCCESTDDCTAARASLPTTFTFRGLTINRADWVVVQTNTGCCWEYLLPTPTNYFTACSAEVTVFTLQTKLTTYYTVGGGTLVRITKVSCKCDAQAVAVNQFVVSISEYYSGHYGNVLYNAPAPACDVLAYAGYNGGNERSFAFVITRCSYYAALPVGSYILTTANVSTCDIECSIVPGANSITLTTATTGQSITIQDTADWTFSTT